MGCTPSSSSFAGISTWHLLEVKKRWELLCSRNNIERVMPHAVTQRNRIYSVTKRWSICKSVGMLTTQCGNENNRIQNCACLNGIKTRLEAKDGREGTTLKIIRLNAESDRDFFPLLFSRLLFGCDISLYNWKENLNASLLMQAQWPPPAAGVGLALRSHRAQEAGMRGNSGLQSCSLSAHPSPTFLSPTLASSTNTSIRGLSAYELWKLTGCAYGSAETPVLET